MEPWVAIQRNPTSGSGKRKRELLALIRRLKQHGLRPRLYSRREQLQAKLEQPEFRESLHCLVAAGGDGTLGDIINRYEHLENLRVAVLPLGTENLVARYLQIPCSGTFVANMIAANVHRRIDLCQVKSHGISQRFAIMASVGFDADVVRLTAERRRGNITKLSYLQPIWDSLRRYQYPELKIRLDDGDPQTCRLAMVMNLPAYAMRLRVATSAKDDDGLLDVRTFEGGKLRNLMRYFWHLKRGTCDQLPDVHLQTARTIQIDATEPVPVQIDGDYAGMTPLEISILPASLDILIPVSDNTTRINPDSISAN